MADTSITIRTDAELAAKVATLAAAMDRSRKWVIEAALREYVEMQAWQIEGIKEAVAALDQGDGIPHEEVMDGTEALLSEHGTQP